MQGGRVFRDSWFSKSMAQAVHGIETRPRWRARHQELFRKCSNSKLSSLRSEATADGATQASAIVRVGRLDLQKLLQASRLPSRSFAETAAALEGLADLGEETGRLLALAQASSQAQRRLPIVRARVALHGRLDACPRAPACAAASPRRTHPRRGFRPLVPTNSTRPVGSASTRAALTKSPTSCSSPTARLCSRWPGTAPQPGGRRRHVRSKWRP